MDSLTAIGVIFAGIIIGAAITVVILRAKRKQSPARFTFDDYKARELDRRGLLDRTKRR